jgi:hypothetical protein
MERRVKEESRRCNKELVKKVIEIKFDSVGTR